MLNLVFDVVGAAIFILYYIFVRNYIRIGSKIVSAYPTDSAVGKLSDFDIF